MSLPAAVVAVAGPRSGCAACPRPRLPLDFLCGGCSKLWARKPREFVQRQRDWLAARAPRRARVGRRVRMILVNE